MERKYVFADNSYLILKEDGNTYLGKLANKLLMEFIKNDLKYDDQYAMLEMLVKQNRAKLCME
jgi:hypothetical protein